MKAQPWQRVFTVFEQALKQSPADRKAFLDQACGSDTALRRGVDMLFEADEEGGATFLERPMIDMLASSDGPGAAMDSANVAETLGGDKPTSPVPPPIATVGPYRILRRIGQGGMSTVYLAVRDDDVYRRRVVIKVVRADRETEPILQRLRAERQILANLEHPHIARLYDGGNTDDGLPYFAMEYVEGVPIDAYCDQLQLSVDNRLILFKKVCAAVHYAHQNLIVHRDIKPSNILVKADGEPKLLDFGIAKLLNPDLMASEVEPTVTLHRMLTPSYASPEQFRGKLVTTASDVYSLGVLLFKMLTGKLPYELKGRSLHEIERLLTELEPPKPSTVATWSGSTPDQSQTASQDPAAVESRSEATASARTEALKRALVGDLDAIVLKALRSTPLQRYASVERFTADIERFQKRLPVAARTASWRYLTGKFIRRNQRAMAVLAALAALIIGFAGALALQAARVAFERDQARLERDKKSRVVALILDIFNLSNPWVMPDAEMTVRQALEHSLPILEDGLSDQPDIRAALLHTTGSIFSALGSFTQAEEQLTEALEIRRRLNGNDDPEVAESMSALASVRKELDDDLDEAERLARQAVEILRHRLGPDHTDLTYPLIELCSVLCYRGKFDSAEPLANEALALAQQLPAKDHRKITALETLAFLHSRRGDYRQSVALNRRALTYYRQLYGEKYPGQIGTLSNLGLQLRRLGELQAAQRTYEEAMDLQRETFGAEYPDLILIKNFAGVRYAMGDYAGAERSYREALAVVLDRYGTEHWRVLSLGTRIARTRTHQGAAAEAERQVRRLLARHLVADDNLLNDEARSVLGESLSVQGRCDEAGPALVESFTAILAKTDSARRRRDAFDRLRDHLERCDEPQALDRYEAMLDSDEPTAAPPATAASAASTHG